MTTTLPAFLAPLIIGVGFVAALVVWLAVRRATTGVLLALWFATTLTLAARGFFRGDPIALGPNLTFPLGLFLPIIVGYAAYRRSDAFRRALDAAPQEWLIGVQVYRCLGVVFLLLLARGQLPAQFALPAACGDILVGATALPVAWVWRRQRPWARRLAIVWNAVGILDLVVAVGVGALSSPTPFRLFADEPSTGLMTQFPLAMIPLFAVPLAIMLHLASLRLALARRTATYDSASWE